jgi:hypothetical protein
MRITSDTVADGIREQLFTALHANPGSHLRVPAFEIDSSIRFSARHPGGPGIASSS